MMKQSHLYERYQQPSTKRLSEAQQKSSGLSQSKNQLIDPLFKMMEFVVQSQERIQIYKEMLTQRNDFSPQPLFNWVSRNQPYIDKRHLITLFQQNCLALPQEHTLKLYFNSYGYKDKIDYSAFVNMIFPQNTQLIKYISVTGIKRYSNNSGLSEDVLGVFLGLVKEEINFLEGLDEVKNQLILKITRKEIKNLMRIIKKNGECNSLMEIDSRPFVKYEELKALFKNYINKISNKSIPHYYQKPQTKKQQPTQQTSQPPNTQLYTYLQTNCLMIFRKLSMGKTSFISLEDFEFWLRPWNMQRGSMSVGEECASNIFTISGVNEIEESKVSFGENENLPLSHRAS